MKRLAVLLLCGLLAVVGVACDSHDDSGPSRGTVTGRSYDDPDDSTWLQQVCTPIGKTMSCTMIPQHTYDGPHWWLRLSNRAIGQHGWREVSHRVYDKCQDHVYCNPRKV